MYTICLPFANYRPYWNWLRSNKTVSQEQNVWSVLANVQRQAEAAIYRQTDNTTHLRPPPHFACSFTLAATGCGCPLLLAPSCSSLAFTAATSQHRPPSVFSTSKIFSSFSFPRSAFPKLRSADHRWSSGSALVVLLDRTLVQKKTEKIKLTWIAYHTL
jgi:hypothetical protein